MEKNMMEYNKIYKCKNVKMSAVVPPAENGVDDQDDKCEGADRAAGYK